LSVSAVVSEVESQHRVTCFRAAATWERVWHIVTGTDDVFLECVNSPQAEAAEV